MKILHISHHYGCLKDHQYICKKLNLCLESIFTPWMGDGTNFPRGYFTPTKDLCNDIWNKNKDYFNSFDYIITSDTAPLSRIFLQNINNFKGKLNIWVCNRFDYDVQGDYYYYSLFREASKNPNINIIPYTNFETYWMNSFGISPNKETITPMGLSLTEKINSREQHYIGYDDTQSMTEAFGDVLVSRYHNDSKFQNTVSICKNQNLKATVANYRGPQEIKNIVNNFICFFVLPEQYSKLVTFEFMQNLMPVIIPSKNYLLNLAKQPNYFFGSGINEQTVNFCEWYNEYYSKYAIYIDSMDELYDCVQFIKKNKKEIQSTIKEQADIHTKKTLMQWKNIYV